jgi:hypothetical protein
LSIKKLLFVCAGVAVMTLSAFAQGAIIRKGVTEVGGFAGMSFSNGGGSETSGSGTNQTHVMGGGNVVYSLTRTFMPFVEMSYFPAIVHSYSGCCLNNAQFTYTNSVALYDFNGGFHLRVPIPRSRIIPYGVISGGLIHTPGFQVVPPAPFTPFNSTGGNQFAVSGGAGIRYYTTERLGFRAEFKAYKPTGGGDTTMTGLNTNTFYRLAFGFFYQF